MTSKDIMTLSQVARYLQMGKGKLYHLAQAGEIPAAKIGRSWRFRRDLVDHWFTEQVLNSSSYKAPVEPVEKVTNGRL